MSDLAADRDHYRRMADADHKTECGEWTPGRWRDHYVHPKPGCGGCNPAADRALFKRLADEIDSYLAPSDATTTDLFGDIAVEPNPAAT